MAKTKTEKIADIQVQIEQLKNQEKRLMQQQKEQERKDRTKRLCKRAGLLESLLPDTIPLTDEQFKIFLERTIITEHSRHILTEIQAGHINPILSKSAGTAQSNGGQREQDEGNGARQSG
ncbi:MAG: DUF3847 domain-containing protein [Oscillospiraceae bacterium]|nr:DUF3847 domain-containing protein [Oscillospiraceae bacterium]